MRIQIVNSSRTGTRGRAAFLPRLCVGVGLLVLVAVASAQTTRLNSKFTYRPPRIDGKIDVGEWDGAGQIRLENGYIKILNDRKRAYFLINVWDQTKEDPEDNIWLTFDVNHDKIISVDEDLNFALDPVQRTLGVQKYLGAGRLSELRPTVKSTVAGRFDSFVADGSTRLEGTRLAFRPHRVWETAIDLSEIKTRAGGIARLGVRVASPASGLDLEPVRGFSGDFSQLIQLEFEAGSIVQALADPNAVFSFPTDFLELTQAVQTRANAIPLVKDKTTVARVYISLSRTTRSQPVWVYLHGRRRGIELPGSPLVRWGQIPLSVQRGDATDTTLFTLPDSWLSGTVEFQVRLEDAFGGEVTSATLTRTFNARQVPLFWIIPVNTGTAASPKLVSDAEIASQMSYLRATYPVADVSFVIKPWTVLGPNMPGNPIPQLRAFHANVLLGWILGYLVVGSSPFDLPMQVYGFTPSGGGESDPIWYYGSGHGYVARGYRGSSREGTMAHEMNHNLDRSAAPGTWGRHVPGGCGATGPDSAWPYSNDDVNEFGFDTRADPFDPDQVSVVPDTWPDFMSYCQSGNLPTKWISPYRYNRLYSVFAPPASGVALHQARLLAAGVEQRLLHISGSLYPKGAGRLNPVLLQPGSPTDEPAGGPYAIEIRDNNGKALRRLTFSADFEPLCENEPPTEIVFDFRVVPPRGVVSSIVLLFKETVLDRIDVSNNAPTVTVTAPNGSEKWSGVQTIAWTATDPDRGDVLAFNLQYSPDDGRSWIPVANQVAGRSYDVDTARLPGANAARIRVIATDGYHTDSDDSDKAFTVVGKPPRPFIRRPQATDLLYAGQVLSFAGEAEDLEDGTLPDPSLRWSIGSQIIGTGRDVQAQLAEGRYEVVLTATDSAGNDATESMQFTVQPPLGGRVEAALQRDGQVRLWWPARQTAVLESAAEVTGPYQATAAEGEIEGADMAVRVSPKAARTFYRLLLVP
ncbi:MAG: hypothetical protein FJ387_17235 [Verrucomicrobia bacterium]|nr:hypothetical protein [Verrucomicrobiota bacterium]